MLAMTFTFERKIRVAARSDQRCMNIYIEDASQSTSGFGAKRLTSRTQPSWVMQEGGV